MNVRVVPIAESFTSTRAGARDVLAARDIAGAPPPLVVALLVAAASFGAPTEVARSAGGATELGAFVLPPQARHA
jgi:hypothetical protein